MRSTALCGLLLLAVACGPAGGGQDGGRPDAGASDAGGDGGGRADGGPDGGAIDGGSNDGGGRPEIIGQIDAVHWPADAFYDADELHLHAVFSPELAAGGLEDPAGWLNATYGWDVFIADGYWQIPPIDGIEIVDEGLTWDPGAPLTFLDAGAFVAAGPYLVAPLDEILLGQEGARVYQSDMEDGPATAARQPIDQALDLEIGGGNDVGAILFPGALTFPKPVALQHPDPLFRLPLRRGSPLTLEWTPANASDDTILFSGFGPVEAFALHIADTGTLDLKDFLESGLVNMGPEPLFAIARLRQRTLQLPEGRVRVVSTSRLWLYGEYVPAWELTPRLVHVGSTETLRLSWYDGTFDPATAWIDLGADLNPGPVRVADRDGHVLTTEVEVPIAATTGLREVRAGDGAGQVVLPGALWVVDDLPGAGSCASAVDEGPLPDGAYTYTDEGLTDGAFDTSTCPGPPPTGREEAIPLHLAAGETLQATALSASWSVLYLVSSCTDTAPARACTEGSAPGVPVTLNYTATTDEDLLLVVDHRAPADAPPIPFAVEIRRRGPEPFVVSPGVVTAGGNTQVTQVQITSLVGPFSPNDTFDLGAGVQVDQVTLGGSNDVAVLDLTLPALTAPETHDVSLTVGGVPQSVPAALTLRPYLDPNASCTEADAAPGLVPGPYAGTTVGGGQGAASPERCTGEWADGPEAIYRVDVPPSMTLRASVRMPTADAVLYLVDTCGGQVFACSDQGTTGRPEHLRWTAAPSGESVYLVVDGYDVTDEGAFYLDVDLSP